MKRLLILTAGFAEVQETAARNLSEALEVVGADARVEVADLFESTAGTLQTVARKASKGLARFAPTVCGGINSLLDSPALTENRLFKKGRLRRELGHLLLESQPDAVVSTYPLYATLIQQLYRDHAERPFRLVTMITDATHCLSDWIQGPSDRYCVADETTAAALRAHAVPADKIKIFGFPVDPSFSQWPDAAPPDPAEDGPLRILYVANPGRKKLGKDLKRLLDRQENQLTVAVGGHAYLKAALSRKFKGYGERVQILGWTNQMPRLLRTHHLVIGKAGTPLLQEAIAAGCPLIANQIVPGPEQANARLLAQQEIGVVATRPREITHWVKLAFKDQAKQWRRWRQNLRRLSQPDAALRIGRWLLNECEPAAPLASPLATVAPPAPPASLPFAGPQSRQLLCDFHIHTNYSDGKLSVPEVVDFYGRRQFDCICITDHLADSRRLIGKLGALSRLTLNPNQLEEYFEVLERERRRAWRKYEMLLMTGLEFNKDGLTRKSSAHLLGIDLKAPILDCLDLPETIAQIHAQGGLAVASHPHIMKSEWGKNTLYLWENQERFAPLLDAWEVANRNNMFNPVSTKRLPYLANSDFHKPKHIYSWKTLVNCAKEPEAIKACIRKNESIAITLYREEGAETHALPVEQSIAGGDKPTIHEAEGASPLVPAA